MLEIKILLSLHNQDSLPFLQPVAKHVETVLNAEDPQEIWNPLVSQNNARHLSNSLQKYLVQLGPRCKSLLDNPIRFKKQP